MANSKQSFLFLIFWFTTCENFILEGSSTSHAQFNKLFLGLNSSLTFEFETSEVNGLLFYTDDGGKNDFYELKLVEGTLRLRCNFGAGSVLLRVGRELNDGKWHRVEIVRNKEEILLQVDEEVANRILYGKDLDFGNISTNSLVFFGGLPSWYKTKLYQLSLPSAFYEPHFKGAVRNVVYASGEEPPQNEDMIAFVGVRSKDINHCHYHNPCQHGGKCISTDKSSICDCHNVDYIGNFCEKEKSPSEATFRGTEFLSFNTLGGEFILSLSDKVSLYFKTRQPHGILFYTGEEENFLTLALRDGSMVLMINLGSGTVERVVRPAGVRFDDNQWHKVVVYRKIRPITDVTSFCHLSLSVDGVYTQRGSTAGTFGFLSSKQLYLGGSNITNGHLGIEERVGFVGCLRKVHFRTDSLSLDLIELAETGSMLIRSHGNLQFVCHEIEAADPITFTTVESFLALPCWEAPYRGSIFFKIRTNEPNGIIMYNSGATEQGDFFAFEILAGHLYLLLNLGSGSVKVKVTTRRVDDGQWHSISLTKKSTSGRVIVDEYSLDFFVQGNSNQLDLQGPLYIGGVGMGTERRSIPPELWSGKLQYGYVGCMKDLMVNDYPVDIALFVQQQDSGSIRPGCYTSPPLCDSQPCLNGGICTEGWNRFICDCSRTNFIGPVCAKDATTVNFDGQQYITIRIPVVSQTQAEDIKLRFRSTHPSGLLLATTLKKSSTHLVITLKSGKIKIIMNLENGKKILHVGHGLNDDQWHTLHVIRRDHIIVGIVDSESLTGELAGHQTILEFQDLYIGAFISSTFPIFSPHIQSTDVTNFTGHMQQLEFNGHSLFEMARADQLKDLQMTAKFEKKKQIVYHPVTFKSKYTYLGFSQLKAYSSMNLYFQFKTLEPNGLILYNAGKEQDFIAIELVNGHLYYIFNLGDGSKKVRSNTSQTLNDNRWHAVTIGRQVLHQYNLMVDDIIATVTITGPNVHLDLDGILYLGGVKRNMYNYLPKLINSKHGFEGCLASIDFNGVVVNPTVDAILSSTLVSENCSGSETKCSNSACANRGVCVQLLNGYTCDCDMTSFTGPTCSDESVAYDFGSGSGIITFTYSLDRRPDTKTDLLTLGFITVSDNAVLVRIDSDTSNDYLQLEIIKGTIFVVYNLGTQDHPVGELNARVDDGQYHVVRFSRSGPNCTIELDHHNVVTTHPSGKQLTIFNSQFKIQIGAKKIPNTNQLEKPFHGIIAGLVFNGDKLLDMASEGHPWVTVEGDVELLVSIPYDLNHIQNLDQLTDRLFYNGDDLIFSESGSGCFDDEDNCRVVKVGSDEDLITPIFIPPTSKPRSPTTPFQLNEWPVKMKHSGETLCDDEDGCREGSGVEDWSFTSPSTSHYLPDKMESMSKESIEQFSSFSVQPLPFSSTFGHLETTSEINNHDLTRTTPSVYQVPIPEVTRKGQDLQTPKNKPKHSADNIALVIGIIVGVLIFVVLAVLVVYKLRNQTDGAYKIDESKNHWFSPVSDSPAFLGGQEEHNNSTLKPTVKAHNLPKKENIKELKEWYV